MALLYNYKSAMELIRFFGSQKRGSIRGYFVPWHNHLSAMALKCFIAKNVFLLN
jgi:hypothetical protein